MKSGLLLGYDLGSLAVLRTRERVIRRIDRAIRSTAGRPRPPFGPSGHRQGRRLSRSDHATKKGACSLNHPSPFGQARTMVYRCVKRDRANDQSHYRYSAVFLHGRFRDWNRNRRCNLPDLVDQSAPLSSTSGRVIHAATHPRTGHRIRRILVTDGIRRQRFELAI
jgi:hypothetical protein